MIRKKIPVCCRCARRKRAHKPNAQEKLLRKIMAKVTQLEGELTAIASRTTKAFREIRGKIDQLTAAVANLTSQLGDADVPQGATDQLEALKALAAQLDDIVPDAPPA